MHYFSKHFFRKSFVGKHFQNIFSYIPSIFMFLVFSVLMLQPHKFQVMAKENDGTEDQKIQEIYKEMLENSQQENNNGEIQFETLLVGEDGETKISYTVSPGDTLSAIAKLFGTTVDAIKKVNAISNDKSLHVGQKLTIAYDKSIIHDVKEDISVKEFAKKYNLHVDDLLTLNYFDGPDTIITKGQQIFLPLNKVEAEERGLIEKKPFVMLDIPKPENLQDKIAKANLVGTLSGEKKIEDVPPKDLNKEGDAGETVSQKLVLLSGSTYQQKIVSAEETAKYLQQLEQAKKEAAIAEKKAKELQKQAEQAKKEAQLKAEQERKEAERKAAEKAEQARLAKIDAEKKAQRLKEAEKAEQERKEAEKKAAEKAEQARLAKIAESCGANTCYYEGKCRSKPKNAECVSNDDNNAWKCKAGFVDTGRSCISESEQKKRLAKATAPKKSGKVLKQRYFNPYKKGYSNGWGGGHCTHYAGYYRHAKLGKETNWRGNAKYRYANAHTAGRRVGQTPKVNSIIVMKYGSQGRNGYGHVGIVIDIDWARRQVLIEDMNYVGRYIVSQHRVDLDSTRNPVIGFVYPD